MTTPTPDPRHSRLVVRTKLMPPQLPRHTLERPRLTQRLLEARHFRVTTLHAGAGFGKSTALAALARAGYPLVWYHLDREDVDPLRFLLHLAHGCSAALPTLSHTPLALLEQWDRDSRPPWSLVVDTLANALAADGHDPLLIVLDDAHYVNDSAETRAVLDRFIQRMPPTVHLLLATRYPLQLDSALATRVRGEQLRIGQSELAFTAGEIRALFAGPYGVTLGDDQAQLLADAIEGWPIALPLIRRRLHGDAGTALRQALEQLAGGSGDLFTYLAHEVLEQLPADVRAFLSTTAILRQLDADLCDCLLGSGGHSAAILQFLQDNSLFVTPVGDQLRYHHLFRDLLRRQLSDDARRATHRRAADCYRERGDDANAIEHLLAAGAPEEAAPLLVAHGREAVTAGQLDRLAEWLASLPPALLTAAPTLLIYLGDIARLRSRFDAALGWYQQAEAHCRAQRDPNGLGQALRGQARVYLDTVNPSQAERLLQEALRLSDGQEDRESQARLLDLLAENLLNQGRMQAAEAHRAQARALREEGPGQAELHVRMLLRTGRLEEARRELARRAEAERSEPVLRPRAHRETLLLLAIIAAMQGDQAQTHRYALDGTQRGADLGSPFITAVGYIRQGEAWLLDKNEAGYERASGLFEQAIALGDSLHVPRLKVEAYWGLCQAYGFRGELERALDSAESGLTIARHAGDEWISACIAVTMGAGYVLAGQYVAAAGWLDQAGSSFHACSDVHGATVTRLWQCLLWRATGDGARLQRDLPELLTQVRDHGFSFLFTRRTLMGPPDPRALVPLLLAGRGVPSVAADAQALLEALGLGHLELHPGYQLRVQTLGAFRLWLGDREVPARAWRRHKARQLCLLFLTYRRSLMHREQVFDTLWPELSPDDAQRDFKIAYNTLCNVLEPERQRNAPSAYIERDGSRYGLRAEADVWFDVTAFDDLIAAADRLLHDDPAAARAHYRQALALYHGDFLQEFPYEEWANQERKRLQNRYLRSAERLARSLLRDQFLDDAVDVSLTLLEHDACWEPAYQVLIAAYAAQGNRSAALRAYQRCVDTLRAELGVDPSPATTRLLD